MALPEFDLKYESAKAVKGQVMSDFVVQHCMPELGVIDLVPWTLFFDGSSSGAGSGTGIVLVSPRGATFELSFPYKQLLLTIRLSTKLCSRGFGYCKKLGPMQ